ncbi:hypothetical protein NWT09_14125 [Mycolicibacterium sp. jd]|uniref:hypothetical protein n=1 Tax=unclassified Mycolicibacterium TaxID=2636767 RepID=UPI00351BB45F
MMAYMSDCSQCARHESVESDNVGAADNLRFARIVLAMLNGAPDAVALIAGETGGCPKCVARLAGAGVGMCTGQMLALGTISVAAEEHRNPAAPPMTEGDRQSAILANAVGQMEQIVLDATDLETGLNPETP